MESDGSKKKKKKKKKNTQKKKHTREAKFLASIAFCKQAVIGLGGVS